MKRKLTTSRLLLLTLSLTLVPTILASTTWYVNGVSGSDKNNCMSPTTSCKTIGHAIARASSGDTIRVAAATYTENLTISKSLKVIGSGATTTIVDSDPNCACAVFNLSSATANVSLSMLTMRHGSPAVANAGTVTITDSTISANHAGVSNGGEMTISNSTISANSVLGNGGGIFNDPGGTVRINNSTISQNAANIHCLWFLHQCYGGSGGGIYNQGTVIITNSTIAENSANGGNGGGIIGGILRINNSTISQNGASRQCPLGCYGGSGGGISSTETTLQNSIVANSPNGGNCSGTITSNGYNLSSDNTCNFNGPGDMNNTNPMLGTLGNHGGPTQTLPLLSGSPAIDAGNPSGCTDGHGHLLTTDQRGPGYPRHDPEDTGGCDMGAYERQSD